MEFEVDKVKQEFDRGAEKFSRTGHSPLVGKNKWLLLVFCSRCFFSSLVLKAEWGFECVVLSGFWVALLKGW